MLKILQARLQQNMNRELPDVQAGFKKGKAGEEPKKGNLARKEIFYCKRKHDPRYCTQYASKFGKLSSGHRPGKGQFSFQFLRKAMPTNAQTIAQLHSSHMLVK